jgi:hypothetical protein
VEKLRQNCDGGIMKNEMLSMLLEKKICFIRSPPDTLQNFRQVIENLSQKVASMWVQLI